MLNAIVLSTFVTLGGWSAHSDSHYDSCNEIYREERDGSMLLLDKTCEKKKYNNFHELISVDYKGFTVGTMRNSYFRRSNFLGYTIRKGNYSALVGTVSGYKPEQCMYAFSSACLMLSLSYTFEPVKVSIMGNAVALSFEYGF